MSIWGKVADNCQYRLPKKKTKMAAWKKKLKDPTKKLKKQLIKAKSDKASVMASYIAELKGRLTHAERICAKAMRKEYGRKAFKCQYGVMFGDNHFFILDFYFPSCKLAIEIDGNSHDDKKEYDTFRSARLLQERNIKVIRFTNEQIYNNMSAVLDVITYEISVTGGVNSRANKNGST